MVPQLLWGFKEDMQCDGCPESALLVGSNDMLRNVLDAATSLLGIGVVAIVLVILPAAGRGDLAAAACWRRSCGPAS